MRKNNLTLKLFSLIVAVDLLESIADLFIKKGINNMGFGAIGPNQIIEFLVKSSSDYLVLIGLLLYIVNFFILFGILSRIELSIAYPAGSTSYIFVTILAMIFLHENVGLIRWSGIILIVSGIYFISRSGKSDSAKSK